MPTIATFTVTLSPTPTAAGSFNYTTIDLTAVAGTDYTLESGTVTFAAGDTTKTIVVPIQDNPAANLDRKFGLVLSNPVGAVLATNPEGICIISTATVVAGLPVVTVGPATIVTTTPAALTPLSALASQFIDTSGNPVQLRGINWYGYDGTDLIVHGLYAGRGYKDMIDRDVVGLGFNCIRLPFADDMITSTVTFVSTSGNQYVAPGPNPDIIGLTPLQALDCIVYYACQAGVRIILDHHRLSITSIGSADSGFGTDGWPASDPTTGTYLYGGSSTPRAYTAATWAAMWESLATHFTTDHMIPGTAAAGAGKYATNAALRATIVGFDPHNEPFHPSWSTWASMVEVLFPLVNAIAPDWMMFVEGVGASADGSTKYWDGGYLREVATRPVNLGSKQNKLAYSAHDYGQSVYGQPWQNTVATSGPPATTANTVTGYPANLEAVFDTNWGFIFRQGIAPLWIGEFGGGWGFSPNDGSVDATQLNAAFEVQWGKALVQYISGLRNDGTSMISGTQKPISFAYFALNPEGAAPLGGLLELTDYTTVQAGKYAILMPLLLLS